MSTTKIISAIPVGYGAQIITVEADQNRGLPNLSIIGMANRTIEESKERIRSAIQNSGFTFPKNKLIVNLAPADLNKTSSGLDLPIAVAILTLSQQIATQDVSKRMFVGELSLDGKIRPIKGILNLVERAIINPYIDEIIIPRGNAPQAALLATKIKITPVTNLRELWLYLQNLCNISPLKQIVKNTETDNTYPIFDEIVGQAQAKRALTIAVAGHHNILLTGPPGTGKSMLAKCIPGLLPPPSLQETIEIAKLHSLNSAKSCDYNHRPFCAPHHTATTVTIIGGGNPIMPGQISLAHHGVLFLDELPEFNRNTLESLRQPLEDRHITVAKHNQSVRYPADFLLVATMNPCPCGYKNSPNHDCTCTPSQIQNYQKKLSGPLLDRIDMTIRVSPQTNSVLLKNTTISTSEYETAKQQIEAALNTQFNRYHDSRRHNANLSSRNIVQTVTLSPAAKQLLDRASDSYQLSARSYFRIIKVARTIADLTTPASDVIEEAHIAEALQYRTNPFN